MNGCYARAPVSAMLMTIAAFGPTVGPLIAATRAPARGVGRQLAVARALPLGRAFWSETWATTRANRSWLALNCSATFALPGPFVPDWP